MKNKKIITIILSAVLVFSAMPMVAFADAGTTSPKLTTTELVKKLNNFGTFIKNNNIRYTKNSSDGQLRDTLREAVIEFYLTEVGKKEDYSQVIWTEIINKYNEILDFIDNTSDFESIIYYYDGMAMVSEEFANRVNVISDLAKMNKNVVKTEEDIEKIRLEGVEAYNLIVTDIDRASYNNYYWDLIKQMKSEMLSAIKSAKTFSELIIAIQNLEYLDETSSPYIDATGITYKYYICTIDDIEYSKSASILYAENYVKLQLKDYAKSNGNKMTQVNAEFNALKSDIRLLEELDSIYNASTAYVKKMEKLTGVKYEEITFSQRSGYMAKVESLFAQYDVGDYSENNWEELENLFAGAEEYISEAEMSVELSDSIITNLKYDADKIPTITEEIKTAKDKYISYLKKYLGNVKYNQSKVAPIVREGISKINVANTKNEAYQSYITYKNKANATIKKFTIKTTKSGLGTVSKTKSVAYGSAYIVKITPKAGYKIFKIYVDGKRKSLRSSYTFKNVRGKHTIKVIFTK